MQILEIIKEDKSRIKAKYIWKEYKTNEGVLSKLKLTQFYRKFKITENKWIQKVQRMDRDRLPHLIMKYKNVGKEAKDDPLKDFQAVNGTGTGQKA